MTRQARFLIQLDRASDQTVSVDYATVADTAAEGDDFTAVTGTITFAPGETQKQVLVPVRDQDQASEEHFQLVLSNPIAAVIADGTGDVYLPAIAAAPAPPAPPPNASISDAQVQKLIEMDLTMSWSTSGLSLTWTPVGEPDFSLLGAKTTVYPVLSFLQLPQAPAYTMTYLPLLGQPVDWLDTTQLLKRGIRNDSAEITPTSPTLVPAELDQLMLSVQAFSGDMLINNILLQKGQLPWLDWMKWRVTVILDGANARAEGEGVRLSDPPPAL